MSICSLFSSLSMTAVLRVSMFTSRRSSNRPAAVIVRTFRVPNFSAGVFELDLFCFVVSGAKFAVHLSD